MEQARLECQLLRCRYLITSCAVQRLGLKDLKDCEGNQDALVRECHVVFKRAFDILTRTIIELESEIDRLSGNGESKASRKHQHWLWLFQLSFESFLWLRFERADIIEIYKGPNHVKLRPENVASALEAANQENQDPYVFAIPLDFTRFSCVGDLLVLRRHPGVNQADFIELKEGPANEAMVEAIESKNPERVSEFLDKYGKKGIKQVERFVRQVEVTGERSKLVGAPTGRYKRGTGSRIVVAPTSVSEYFTAEIDELCGKARDGEYAAITLDECLMVAAADTSSLATSLIGDYNARLLVLDSFIASDDSSTYSSERRVAELSSIKLTAWTEGLGSMFFMPPLLRPLSTRSFLDLMFDRIRLYFYLDAARFLQLTRTIGLKAGFLNRKKTNRLKAAQHWGQNDYPIFEGRALGYVIGAHPMVMGSVRLHQMFFNWERPSSVAREIASAIPVLLKQDFGISEDSKPAFTERDLET
jgi:hypothetical protein